MTHAKGTAPHQEKPLGDLRELLSGNREASLVESRTAIDGWPKPAGVVLDGGYLRQDWLMVTEGPEKLTRPSRTLLDRFLTVATSTDGQIRLFAEQWGLLFPSGPDSDPEAVETWRAWSRCAMTVLRFAELLHFGREATDEDRAELAKSVDDVGGAGMSWPDAPKARVRMDSEMLTRAVNHWLGASPVATVFLWSWKKDDPEIRQRPQSLIGALALDVARVAKGPGSRLEKDCEICGEPFVASRTSDRFCSRPECRRRAVANRQARSRARRASHLASQTARKVPDVAGRSERKRPA